MPVGATSLSKATTEKFYIKLTVYNYDASPRMQTVRHDVKDVATAKRTADRLNRLIKGHVTTHENTTVNWLERNHRIYGFVERVDGIFREVTTRIE